MPTRKVENKSKLKKHHKYFKVNCIAGFCGWARTNRENHSHTIYSMSMKNIYHICSLLVWEGKLAFSVLYFGLVGVTGYGDRPVDLRHRA